jgi:hypothetical protein
MDSQKKILAAAISMLFSITLAAQVKDSSDLMNTLEKEMETQNDTKYATAIFKTTRLVKWP